MVTTESKPTYAAWPRHRWVSLAVIVAGLILALLAGWRLGGDLPELQQIRSEEARVAEPLFHALLHRPDLVDTHSGVVMSGENNPFYTDHFKPPPKPAPPPKPTMKQVEVLYQGWFESSKHVVEAFVTIDGKKASAQLDQPLGQDFTLLEIRSDYLELKSKDDQEHQVPFKKATKLKVPIK